MNRECAPQSRTFTMTFLSGTNAASAELSAAKVATLNGRNVGYSVAGKYDVMTPQYASKNFSNQTRLFEAKR